LKPQVPDEQLIREDLAGNQRAFDEIVARYKGRLFQWTLKFIGDPQRAEERTQETFIRVVRHLRSFDPERSFRTWIYRIAVNLAKNELRDRSRRPRALSLDRREDGQGSWMGYEPRASRLSEPDVQAEREEFRRAVLSALQAMPPKFREVLLLREVEGMSYEEIAQVLRRPLGTVRSRVNRARSRFRKQLEPYLRSGREVGSTDEV